MYGDLHQLFLVKSDVVEHENEIVWESDLKHNVDKYSKSFNSINSEDKLAARAARTNNKIVENKNLRSNNEVLEQPHFRPTTNKSKPTKHSQTTTVKENLTVLDNIIKILDSDSLNSKNKTEKPSNIFLINKTTKLTSGKVKVDSNKSENNDAEASESDTVKAPENIDKYVIETFGNHSVTSNTISHTTERTTTVNTQEKPIKLSSTLKNDRPQEIDDSLLEGEVDNDDEEAEEAIITEIFGLNDEKVQDDESQQSEKNKLKGLNKKNLTETQLFQDTLKNEKEKEPQRRGV